MLNLIISRFKLFLNIIKQKRYAKLDLSQQEQLIRKLYKKKTNQSLDLMNPRTYTEKINYSKLYLNTKEKSLLSDKYLVRKWIKNTIGEQYLIPLLGVWEDPKQIDYNLLPEQFVFKTNHGSGTNIIVKDKLNLNKLKTNMKLRFWLAIDYGYFGDIQPHYSAIQPLIIAEKYITDSNGELNDYKFFCFNGEPYYVWVDVERSNTNYRNVYDLDWNLMPWNQIPNSIGEIENFPEIITRPPNFEQMIEIARKLSQNFSHVRVDLYNVDGKIYFGEMTFTNGSGYSLIQPDQYNKELGDLWELESK